MTEPTPSTTSTKKVVGQAKWAGMASLVVFLFFVAGAGAYYSYVVQHQEYVIDRNFRLLALHGKLLTETIADLRQVFQSALEIDTEPKDSGPVNNKALSCLDETLRKELLNAKNPNSQSSGTKAGQALDRFYKKTRKIGANLCLSGLKNVKIRREASISEGHKFNAKVKEETEGVIELKFHQVTDWKFDRKQLHPQRAKEFYEKIIESKEENFKVLHEEILTLPYGKELLAPLKKEKNHTDEDLEKFAQWMLPFTLNQLLRNPFLGSHLIPKSHVKSPQKVEALSNAEYTPERLEELNRRILAESFPAYIRYAVGLGISGELNFGTLVEKLELDLEHEMFDDLLIAMPDGHVIHQENSTRFLFHYLDSLFQSQGTDQSKSENAQEDKDHPSLSEPESHHSFSESPKDFSRQLPYFGNAEVGGIDYKVFAQLVPLLSSASNHDTSSVVIVGLVEQSKFLNESLAVSHSDLLLLLFAISVLFLAFPFLKLLIMGHRDRLTLMDILFLLISSFVGTGVLAFLILNWTGSEQIKEQRDQQLVSLSEQLIDNFSHELHAIVHQMKTLEDTMTLPPHGAKPEKIENLFTNTLIDPLHQEYPYFNLVFWADEEGTQQRKWTVGSRVTPFISVKTREYFQRAKEDRLWEFAEPLSEVHPKPHKLFVQPTYSRTTGKFTVDVSSPSNIETNVMVLEAQLLSLVEPVLPQGFKFAVVRNNDGTVLFHSDKKRNVRENFIHETGENRNITSLLYAGQSGFVDAKYWGLAHRLFLKPVSIGIDSSHRFSLPWTMIVFANSQNLETIQFESLSISVFLFGIYTTIMSLLFVFGVWLFYSPHSGPFGWLWPREDKWREYRLIGFGHVILISVFSAIMAWKIENPSSHTQDAYLIWTTLYPVVGLLFMYGVLRGYQFLPSIFFKVLSSLFPPKEATEGRKDTEEVSHNYLFMVVTSLVLMVLLPAFTYYKFVNDSELRLSEKYSQYEMINSLNSRAHRIVTRYSNIAMNGKEDEFIDNSLCWPPKSCKKKAEDKKAKFIFDVYKPNNLEFFQKQPNSSDKKEGMNPSTLHSWSDCLYGTIREQLLFNASAEKTAGFLQNHTGCSLDPWDYNAESDPSEVANEVGTHWVKENIRSFSFPPADGYLKSTIRKWEWWPLGLALVVAWIALLGTCTKTLLNDYSARRLQPEKWKTKIQKFIQFFPGIGFGLLFVLLVASTHFETLLWIEKLLSYLIYGLGFIVFLLFLYSVACFICRRAFFLHFATLPLENSIKELLENPKELKTNLILVGPPNSGKSAMIQKNQWYKIDLHDLDQDKDWFPKSQESPNNDNEQSGAGIEGEIQDKQFIVIDHFEHLLGNTQFDEKKLELLEILQNKKKRICILSSVDFLNKVIPSHSEDEQKPVERQQIEMFQLRWARILQTFSIEYLHGKTEPDPVDSAKDQTALKGFLKKECGINGHLRNVGSILATKHRRLNSEVLTPLDQKIVVSEIFDLAEPYYRALWLTCSENEKLTLFHLAKDRFLNSKNHVIRPLLKKGLIHLDPTLRMMNESFRRFVLIAGEKEKTAELEHQGPPSVWRMVSRPLGFVFIVLLLFLVATQEQLRRDAMAFAGLTPALLPVMLRLFSSIKSGKAG